MPTKLEKQLVINSIDNMPLSTETYVMVGSFTTETLQPPQGEVMRLTLSKIADNQPEEAPAAPPLFGAHIREGVAVVKDWIKKP